MSKELLSELAEQGLQPEINEIIMLTAVQPPWQEKFEPSDTVYMTTEQLFALVEMLNPSFDQDNATTEISQG